MSRITTARLLRRLTLRPDAALVDRFADADHETIVGALLDQPGREITTPDFENMDDPWSAVVRWWLDQMRHPDAGLHERMVWFWHGHLTSGLDKAPPRMLAAQHQLLRRHAFGNFRELLREITLDPAMLWWLDGSGSWADDPNENYARELMELFALGRGHYTETDVHNGARALAGYWVDDGEDGDRVEFNSDGALRTSVEFLGRRVRTVDDVIDAVCDHPACAPWIAGKVHEAFHGSPPDETRRAALAEIFASSGLEIRPLVEAVVTDPSLADAPDRPRSALEWYLALELVLDVDMDPWSLERLGQTPLNPPNVAGWPGHERWLSAGIVLTKAQIAMDYSWDSPTLDDDDPVGDVLRRANLDGVSETTRRSLDELAGSIEGRRERSTLLSAAVAMTPEFNLT